MKEEKIEEEEGEDSIRVWLIHHTEHWYDVNTKELSDEIAEQFVQCHQDAETEEFLENCYEKSDWLFTQLGQAFAKSVLSWFMSNTSINGYLQRGSMFIFSQLQLQALLGVGPDWMVDRLMDLGAGDGRVTATLSQHARHTYVTEVSPTMQKRLINRGYTVLGLDEWSDGTRRYDLIGCLNLLDRCNKPITLLHSMKKSLTPVTGRVIMAVVLPFKPFVEEGSTDHMPSENLHIYGKTFEQQIQNLVSNVFTPAGFCVERFTKLPYLCEGDLKTAFFILVDAVFVLKVCD